MISINTASVVHEIFPNKTFTARASVENEIFPNKTKARAHNYPVLHYSAPLSLIDSSGFWYGRILRPSSPDGLKTDVKSSLQEACSSPFPPDDYLSIEPN
jgi:hypothetical protein